MVFNYGANPTPIDFLPPPLYVDFEVGLYRVVPNSFAVLLLVTVMNSLLDADVIKLTLPETDLLLLGYLFPNCL